MQESVPVPKLALNVLKEKLDDLARSAEKAGEELRHLNALQLLLAHIFHCQTRMPRRYGKGVPVSHALLKEICREVGDPIPTCTADIWGWAEVKGLLRVRDHSPPSSNGETSRRGQSREFLLSEAVLEELMEGVEQGCRYKTRYDLTDGRRIQKRWKTRLTYDGTHSWKERSPLIYKTLKALKGQRDLVNKGAVEKHLAALKEKATSATEQYEDAQAELKAQQAQLGRRLSKPPTEALSEGVTTRNRAICEATTYSGDTPCRGVCIGEKTTLRRKVLKATASIETARKTALKAFREMKSARARYRQDLRIWADIVFQGLEEAEDMPEGIYQYETAYEVQVASGRLTMRCGLQNASKEMKAAAATGIPGCLNVDIKSSQTEGLIGEMKRAASMGADLEVSILVDYAKSGGKDGLAERFGIDRELWKRPEHAVKFGADFHYKTVKKALQAARRKVHERVNSGGKFHYDRLHQFRHETRQEAYRRAVRGQLSTMAATALDWSENPDILYDDPERIYEILEDAYGRMATEIDKWRSWLVCEHWSEVSEAGGRGRHFKNPCGIPFSIWDPNLREKGHSGGGGVRITRYAQKVAYATTLLQGREAAYMHCLTLLAKEFGYEFLRNEHDGAVLLVSPNDVSGDAVSEECAAGSSLKTGLDVARLLGGAPKEASRRSSFYRAELEIKPFSAAPDSSTEKPNTKGENRGEEQTTGRHSESSLERRGAIQMGSPREKGTAQRRLESLSGRLDRTAGRQDGTGQSGCSDVECVDTDDWDAKMEAAARRIWGPCRLPPSSLL